MDEQKIEEFKTEMRSVMGCCLHEPQFQPDEVVRIIAWAWTEYGNDWKPAPKEGTDSESAALVQLADGTYGVFTESEDYTGHGCQCGSGSSRHATEAEAFEQGLTPEEGAGLRKFIEPVDGSDG